MKKKFLILFMFFFCYIIKAEKQFVVWYDNGNKVAFPLSENTRIEWWDDRIFVYTEGIDYGYRIYLDEIVRFTYEGMEDSAIKNIENDMDSSFSLDGELLIFPDLKAGSTVSIYSLAGAMVFSRTVETAGKFSFPLTKLEKGIYMVKVNGLTNKIEKK